MSGAATIVVAVALAGCGRIDFEPRVDATVDPDLVAYYPFEVLSQGLSPDATGHGHDATCSVCPSLQPSPHGNAAQFDGAMQRMDVPSSPALETTAAFTVTAWVRIDVTPATVGCAFNKGYGTDDLNSWQLCVRSNRSLLFAADGTGQTIYSTDTLVLGRWYHVAVRWDGAVNTLVLDGTEAGASAGTDAFDGSPLHFGVDIDFGAPYAAFAGWIDEIRIYDRALDITEIAALAGS